MAQTLLDLAKLISDAASQIDAVCKRRGATFPELHDTFTEESDAIRGDSEVASLAAVLVAAADQMVATVLSPNRVVLDTACGVSSTELTATVDSRDHS